jgi:hypothetical protein
MGEKTDRWSGFWFSAGLYLALLLPRTYSFLITSENGSQDRCAREERRGSRRRHIYQHIVTQAASLFLNSWQVSQHAGRTY